MDWILAILIVSFLVYALAYRIGVIRGRKESRMKEYRHGYRKGYEQAREDISGLFQLEDHQLLTRIRELRKTYRRKNSLRENGDPAGIARL